MNKLTNLIVLIGFLFSYPIGIQAKTIYVYIDQVEYIINTDSIKAKVDGTEYFNAQIENLVIPDYIEYEGTQYPVTSVGGFSGHTGITGSLSIGNNVTIIEDYAFWGCKFNGSLTLGNNVEIIGGDAFEGFIGSLTIPNSVVNIGRGAFSRCKFTGTLEIGKNVTQIGSHAFGDYYSDNKFTGSLTIPNSVVTIEDRAFYKCGFTGSLTIPNSVTTIGDYAFHATGFNGSLNIGNSVTTIGKGAFNDCNFTGSLTIPNSVTTIGDYAFYTTGFNGSLNIGNSVTTIGERAFVDCNFTGSLTIPNSVTTIGDYAFSGCSGLAGSLTIPENVSFIGSGAFAECNKITSVEIKPQNIEINYGAFCMTKLKSVTCMATIPPPCIYNPTSYIQYHDCVFGESKTYKIPLYVPAQSIDSYKTATEWKKFININPIPVSATSISLNKSETSMLVGESETLIATLEPEGATDEIDWSVTAKPSGCIIVENGKITAQAVGTATITATAGEHSATCKVTVNPVVATGISLDVNSYEAVVGDSFKLTATVLPESANQELKWETSNPKIATVSEGGEVVATGCGTAIITVSTTDGSAISATCEISAWLRGDSNGDDMVNVADVVNGVNYIVGKPMNKFVFVATDMNNDKDVTITDATMIAQLILNADGSSMAMRKLSAMRSAAIGNNYVNVSHNGSKLSFAMDNSEFSAFQSDIVLLDGVELKDIRLINGAKDSHTLMTSIKGNAVRVIVFALDNAELIANEPFMELTLKDSNNYSTISIEQPIASDATAEPYPLVVRLNGQTSGVESIEESLDIKIEAATQGVRILGGENKVFNIYNVDGSLINSGNVLPMRNLYH